MKIVFMGTAAFAVPALKKLQAAGHEIALVVCQPDRPKGRGHELQAGPLKVAAQELGLDVFQPLKIKEPAAVARVQEAGAELLCVVAYGQILPKAVLDAPKRMALNVHASLLPKFRGAAPIEWAVAAGDSVTGVCVQKMAERLDSGDVISRAELAIGPDEGASSLTSKLSVLGADLLLEAVAAIVEGREILQPQDEAQASYAPLLKKSDGAADFSQAAAVLYNRYRAFGLRPGFYSKLGAETLKILKLRPGAAAVGEAGALLSVGSQGFEVACGDQKSVWIEELLPPGGKAMPAADYARGRQVKIGMKFELPLFERA